MADCLFCKLLDGKIPAKIVHQDAECMAIQDINPQAPMHVLVIPRKHIPTLDDLTEDDRSLVGHLHLVAAALARAAGHTQNGFRTVFNTNRGAGQTVYHIHLHLLAGRELGWPPG